LLLAVSLGAGLLGGLHWRYSEKGLSTAKVKYEAALARFKDSDENEKPAHEVMLTKPFYIGKYELTQEQYRQVVGSDPSCFNGRELPVETVLWDEAQEFCKKASTATGSIVRLPTEAEWERACRAGTRTAYYTGDSTTDLDRAGWFKENSHGKTHPVGQKVPNPWGIHDMHGNVWEWCADWRGGYKAATSVDPQGPTEGLFRVLRGGSHIDPPEYCQSSARGGRFPHHTSNDIVGFRVVLSLPETQ